MELEVAERVEVFGGSGQWLAAIITKVTPTEWHARLNESMLASEWEGRPRKFDGTIRDVVVSRNGFTEGTHIRRPKTRRRTKNS